MRTPIVLDTLNPLIVLGIIVGVFAVIAVIAFVIYRKLNPKLKEDKPSEEQYVQEELDRVLVTVEDEETAKQINEYKDKEDE